MGHPATNLARMFAAMARSLAAQESVDRTVVDVVRLAVAGIPGCEHAGVFLIHRGGKVETAASTSERINACDRIQQELGEGPCLDAIWDEQVRRVDDMSSERRWPRFAARAADLGIRSMLCCQLAADRGTLGSLNLYAGQPAVFGPESAEMALIFATHAGLALQSANLQAQLHHALETRQGIGQAIGMLVERHHINEKQAFELLVRASQNLNEKLHDIAEAVVRSGFDPSKGGRDR